MECGEKQQQQIFIVAIDDKTGTAYTRGIYIDSGIYPENYLKNNCVEYFAWDYDYEYIAYTAKVANCNRDNGLLGKFLKCKQCGKYYYLSQSDIGWYKTLGLSTPKRCKACRKNNKKKN